MLIIDAHEDIAYNALAMGRDFRLSAYTIRERENIQSMCGDIAMSGLPEVRRGNIGIVFGTIFAHPHGHSIAEEYCDTQAYRNADEAYQIGQAQLAYYHQLAQQVQGISLVLSKRDLKQVLTAWEHSQQSDADRPLGIVPLMEGADPIRTPDTAAQWFNDGLRIVGLAWTATRYSGGTSEPGPVTPAGKALLTEMERIGFILDTTHLSEESFWQALAHFHGPVIASHSNCRTLTMAQHQLSEHDAYIAADRQLSDAMIRALTERGGVIGVVPYNRYLTASWSRDHRVEIGLDYVVRHIDHICQLTGNALHVGIGSDVDGGFGRDETPLELDTIADLTKLINALAHAGYKTDDIACIMGENWRRFLASALPD